MLPNPTQRISLPFLNRTPCDELENATGGDKPPPVVPGAAGECASMCF